MYTKVLILVAVTFFLSCKAGELASHDGSDPDDDLSKYMYKPKRVVTKESDVKSKDVSPASAIRFEKHLNLAVNTILDSMAMSNIRYQSASGYRIMVYSGGSSEESSNAKKEVYDWSTEHDVYAQYKQPAFRVKVGNFPDRIQAYHVLSDLIKIFPNAVIIPDQIDIK
jgi:hypothetical protein